MGKLRSVNQGFYSEIYLKRARSGLIAAAFAATMAAAAAQDAGPPKLRTNEAYVEEVTRATALKSP